MQNEPLALTALIAGVVIVFALALLAWRSSKQRRSAALRQHFGPEYDRALAQHGDRTRAEEELASRKKRLDELDIHLLSAEQCARFGTAWSEVQQRFIDDPSGAVIDADALVKEVMKARGYPVGNFEQRVADLSVEHANVVHHYRAARVIALDSAKGQAGTEDLRQAMVHYRALFADLLRAEGAYAPLNAARA
jgi:hypothetical protein